MYARILKFNPYHDEQGLFSSHENAASVSSTAAFAGRHNIEALAKKLELNPPKIGKDAKEEHEIIARELKGLIMEGYNHGHFPKEDRDAMFNDLGFALDVYKGKVQERLGVTVDITRNGKFEVTGYDFHSHNGKLKYGEDALNELLGPDHGVTFNVRNDTRNFDFNGMSGEYAGSYNSATLRIEVHSQHMRDEATMLRILSHEAQHHKFAVATMKGLEFDWVDSKDGQLQTDSKWSFLARPDLIESDGVTAYSRDWWSAVGRGQSPHHSAVNETLAEIATLSPEERNKRVKKPWRDLFNKMNQLYKEKGDGK